MIYFYGEGRLGNQVFQYQALSRIAKPGESIIAAGLEELQRSLDLLGPRLVVVTRLRMVKLFVKHLLNPLLLRPLSRTLRLFNYATEPSGGNGHNVGPSGVLTIRRGLLSGITFVDGGHYQNSAYWTQLFPVPLLRIKRHLREVARSHLHSIGAAGRRPAFVHIRRCDYLTHTDYGLADLSLPLNYYRQAIAELARHVDNAYLVFVTDDPHWTEQNFKYLSEKLIVSFDAATDFAIMTECAAGIVSNSTFSLAAALMLANPDAVIGPEFWFGFRVKAWYPPKIRFQHPLLSYVPVDP